MVKVFVYGSLKRGECNHRLLMGRAIFVGDDTIKAKLFDLGAYPAITQGTDVVSGEVWTVGPTTLADLDRLEGHPVFYKREVVQTAGGHEVWVYFLPEGLQGMKAMYLPEGVWHRRAA